MKKFRFIQYAVLGICGFVVSAPAGDWPTRPIKLQAVLTNTVSLVTGEYTSAGKGISSHMGVFTITGAGQYSFDPPALIRSSGSATAANGDELFWEIRPEAPTRIAFTGGTGRFADAVGGFDIVDPEIVIIPGPEDTTVLEITRYSGAGEISWRVGNGAKDRMRPLKLYSKKIFTLNIEECTFTFVGTGQCSHIGAFTLQGTGAYDPVTLATTRISWTTTAANGDQLFCECRPDLPDRGIFLGGTGRFEGVTGYFDAAKSEGPFTPGPLPHILLQEVEYWGNGVIAY